MKKCLAALSCLALLASCGRREPASAGYDFDALASVVVLDGGRHKPLDTQARELLHELTGKENFRGFKGADGAFVEVFPSGHPVESVLRMAAQPEVYKSKPIIRIQFPEVREKYGKDRARPYFSPEELTRSAGELQRELEEISRMEAKDRRPYHRAVQHLAEQMGVVRTIFDEVRFQIVPTPYGEKSRWPSVVDLEGYLEEGDRVRAQNPTGDIRAFLEVMDRFDRAKLRRIVDLWGAVKTNLAEGKAAEFNRAAAELREALRTLNPVSYLPEEKIRTELFYNAFRPFTKAWLWGYGPAVLLFLLSFAFSSAKFRSLGLLALGAGIGLHVYGYVLRWQIAARYPLANMYESMVAMGLLLAMIGTVMELLMRSRVFGVCAAAIATLCVVAAEEITIFSPFVSQQQPALLNEVLMTIHVPTIMAAYGCGLLCTGVGFAYILTWLFAPHREETLRHLDLCLYRILQITNLLLIGGIALGAVWAGEAWGRWWGWDQKEVWSLITLLWYLAMLHARFTGKVKGLLLANAALVGFAVIMLSYVGVNILFGTGLHSYGHVLGATWGPLLGIFAAEAVLILASAVVYLRRKSHGQARIPSEIPG
jgi:ABC-type transport system involved in cytochrome c biogenesis permease subunit